MCEKINDMEITQNEIQETAVSPEERNSIGEEQTKNITWENTEWGMLLEQKMKMLSGQMQQQVEKLSNKIQKNIEGLIKTEVERQMETLSNQRLEWTESAAKLITYEQDINQLKKQIDILKHDNAELMNANQNLNDEKEILLKEKQQSEKEAKEAIKKNIEMQKDINEKLVFYKPAKPLLEAYHRYLDLSDETKGRLENIFKNSTLESFISEGTKWDNILGLWGFLKRKIIEGEVVDVDGVHAIFRSCYEMYNKKERVQYYALICPQIGSKFDSDKQVIPGTKTDGFVEAVLLEGIEEIESKKVIQKAVIQV